MSLPVRLALHSRIKAVWLTDERRWRSYRNHRCKQGSSCSGLRGRIDSRVAQLSAAGNSVLIIEAGIDAKDVPAVYDAERRGQLNGTCNWKYQSYGDNGAPLSWKIDSGVRCFIFLLWSSILTRSYRNAWADPRRVCIAFPPFVCLLIEFVVNGMVWYRPTKMEIDALETFGNPGWNWASLEPVSFRMATL